MKHLIIILAIILASCQNKNTSVQKNIIIYKCYNIYGFNYQYINNDGYTVTFYEQTDKYEIGDKLFANEKTK